MKKELEELEKFFELVEPPADNSPENLTAYADRFFDFAVPIVRRLELEAIADEIFDNITEGA